MENPNEQMEKGEEIVAYLFLAIMAAITIGSAWVIYSSWKWVLF